MNRLIISPCCHPEMPLDDVLRLYSGLGFKKFEGFSGWAKSAFDFRADPLMYQDKLNEYGMVCSSFHLPIVTNGDASLNDSIQAARFAHRIGTKTVIFKASTRDMYKETAKVFLDAIKDTDLTPVLTNHTGKAITTLEDYRHVISLIDDARMKYLLEVGHFHSVGVSWRDGYALLKDGIELVHIKDQVGKQSVPYGTGEIDLKELITFMENSGYKGDYVVEMEVKDKENTTAYLKEAIQYLKDVL